MSKRLTVNKVIGEAMWDAMYGTPTTLEEHNRREEESRAMAGWLEDGEPLTGSEYIEELVRAWGNCEEPELEGYKGDAS